MSIISSKILQPYLHVQQRGPTWEQARKKHIGASDFASAALVEGAYDSRRALFQKLKGIKVPKANIAMNYGADKERYALGEFVEQFGEVHQVGMVLYDRDPFKSCSPDGIWIQPEEFKWRLPEWIPEDPRWLVEFKCPFTGVKYADVPPHHQAQVLGQMEICGIHKALYCVWSPYGDDHLDVWAVRHDPDQWKELESRIDQFLGDHLFRDLMPGVQRGPRYYPDLERVKVDKRC